jgi:hypothetical protein
MKKFLIAMLILASAGAMAQHRHQGGYGYRGNWIAPAIIGGVIGYGLTRNYYEPYYVPAPPVYYAPPIVMQPPYPNQTSTCTVWTEVQDQDGTITRTRTCRQ